MIAMVYLTILQEVTLMQNFTKQIAVDTGFSAQFSFHQIYKVNGSYYHVSVSDDTGQNFAFSMELKNGKWKIINAPKVPRWIMTQETKLGRILKSTVD